MSAALRELHLHPEVAGRDLTEEDFYRIFLQHTPPGLEDEFRDLYRRLYGGPYADAEKLFMVHAHGRRKQRHWAHLRPLPQYESAAAGWALEASTDGTTKRQASGWSAGYFNRLNDAITMR